MTSSIIVGSGPAAAGAALALCADPEQQVTVVDLGLELDDEARSVAAHLATLAPESWDDASVDRISVLPTGGGRLALPEKRSFGSPYPFADAGQLAGITVADGTNGAAVSGAYGGFSTVWGAQVLPFTSALLARWPVAPSVMERHYKAVLHHIPFAGGHDDLAELFPLLVEPQPLPALSSRSLLTLGNYHRHRSRLRAMGVTVGRARLAMSASGCTRCGLCMTGCPYGLIYSSAHTFDALRRRGRITYRPGLLVRRIEERAEDVVLHAVDRAGSDPVTFIADRVFVACGGVGTARLVLSSLDAQGEEVVLRESRQFAVPFLSRRPTPDPRALRDFTLNQFNVALSFDDDVDVSVIHFYSYNPALLSALPAPLQRGWAGSLVTPVLARLTVALGYVPGWHSPSIRLRLAGTGPGPLAAIEMLEDTGGSDPAMVGRILQRLREAAPLLDLWPVRRAAFVSGPAKSYHFGGTFPHAGRGRGGRFSTDRLGRLRDWRRVHLVDGSVLPDVPATTFTLTVMANAHRIAHESLRRG